MMNMKKIVAIVALCAVLFFSLAPAILAAPDWWPLVPCGLKQVPEGKSSTDGYTLPCNYCDLLRLLKNLIDFVLFAVTPIVAVLLFVVAGFYILLYGAYPGMLEKGKKLFWDTIMAVIIILISWLLVNFGLKSLAPKSDLVPTEWWKLQCTYTPPVATPVPTVTPSVACRQQFAGIAPSSGCVSSSQCKNVNNLTPTHGCETNGGNCLLSESAAQRAQVFVSTFDQLAAGAGCTLRLSSTIQGVGGPSGSDCHKSGNAKSGTCADFNLLPSHDACYQKFYEAAARSGAVVSFLDEYVAACKPSNATGGNIHVNF